MPVKLSAFGASDTGRKRKANEDAFAVDEERGFYLLADGMGGHQNGAIAAQSAISIAREYLNADVAVFDRYRDDPSDARRAAAIASVEKAIQGACARVFQLGQQDQTKRGMGSTLDVVVRVGTQVILGHVGDGRVYLVRAGQSYRLTEDHTIVAQQIKAGIISAKEAEESTLKGVLTRAIGTHQSVQVDTLLLDVMEGDLFLICSDGLHRYLRDEDVPLRLREASVPGAKSLIDHANANGGEDNVTVIVIGARSVGPAAHLENTKTGSGIDAVRSLPIFQHLSYKEQVAILAVAQSRIYEPGATIVKQGDAGNEMFIVVDGEVAVERDGIKIATLGAGGHFGEMSIVDDAPRMASVRATKRTDVLAIGQAEIGGLMRLDPVLAVKILWSFVEALSARLRVASAELIEFKLEAPRMTNVPAPFSK
jgi:serine/threonine protein phosphatase PrpC